MVRTWTDGLVLLASLAAAAAVEGRELPVEVHVPSELLAGASAEVSWEPAPGLDLAEGIEEWEAFLSLDGGRSHPVRITPHLGRARRCFRFRVPPLPTDHARILLRFGDEVTEVEHEVATTIRILPWRPPEAAGGWPADVVEAEPGEAARGGEGGVVAWAEGGRDGADPSWHRWEPRPEAGAGTASLIGLGDVALDVEPEPVARALPRIPSGRAQAAPLRHAAARPAVPLPAISSRE